MTEGFIGKTIEFIIGFILGWVIPVIAGFLGAYITLLLSSFGIVNESSVAVYGLGIGILLELGFIFLLFKIKKWVGIGSLVSVAINFVLGTVMPLYFGVE